MEKCQLHCWAKAFICFNNSANYRMGAVKFSILLYSLFNQCHQLQFGILGGSAVVQSHSKTLLANKIKR